MVPLSEEGYFSRGGAWAAATFETAVALPITVASVERRRKNWQRTASCSMVNGGSGWWMLCTGVIRNPTAAALQSPFHQPKLPEPLGPAGILDLAATSAQHCCTCLVFDLYTAEMVRVGPRTPEYDIMASKKIFDFEFLLVKMPLKERDTLMPLIRQRGTTQTSYLSSSNKPLFQSVPFFMP